MFKVKATPEIVAILEKARKNLARKGAWCQGEWVQDNGSHCTAGAIMLKADGNNRNASNGTWSEKAEPAGLYFAKKALDAGSAEAIYGWNDNPKRTKAEVLEKFDCVIKAAKEELAAKKP